MSSRRTAKFFSALCFLACTVSCSSPEPASTRYQTLDYDTKTVFLTYYPYLSREQKDELLSGDAGNPQELIREWAGQFNDPNHEVGSFDEMMNNARNRKLNALEIAVEGKLPVQSGTRLPLRADAVYLSGKKIDVTPDVEWHVQPNLGQVRKNVLQFDCVNSDLTITANFLQEKESAKTISIRKPIANLELNITESRVGDDGSYLYQLSLLAHCKDGTTSDVSCQAAWDSNLLGAGRRASGCGNVVVDRQAQLAAESPVVKARYGELSVKKTLHPPLR